MSARLTSHLRNNIVGYVAVFIALSAGAYAAGLKKNSVKSKQIKDGAVVGVDVGDDSLTGVDIQEPTLQGINAVQLNGSSAAAFVQGAQDVGGSDLTGTYASPAIAAGAVGPDELSQVPAARVSGNAGACGFRTGHLDGVEKAIQFTDEEFDQGNLGNVDCSTFPAPPTHEPTRLTAPRAGLYAITGGLLWEDSAVGKRTIAIRLNETTYLTQEEYDAAASGATLQNAATIARLAQGDFVQLTAVQTGNPDLAVRSQPRTYLAMAWLGP